jgi:hypothetical protein
MSIESYLTSIASSLERIAEALEEGSGPSEKASVHVPAEVSIIGKAAVQGSQPTIVTPHKNPVGRPRKIVNAAPPVEVVNTGSTTAVAPTAQPVKKLAAKDVADAVVGLVAKDRPAAIAILAEYKVTQVAALDPKDYPAVLAAAKEGLAAFLASQPAIIAATPAVDPLA